ncbi:AAA family ATPase [Enterococcus faecium]|nr:AAA family ATPase [Enterococcus faecium]
MKQNPDTVNLHRTAPFPRPNLNSIKKTGQYVEKKLIKWYITLVPKIVRSDSMGNKLYKYIPDLILSAFEGDKDLVEMSSLNIIRLMKKEDPDTAKKIVEIISNYQSGASLTRSHGVAPLPKDEDSSLNLVSIEKIENFDSKIFLSKQYERIIEDFLNDRLHSKELLKHGILPANSLLLSGPPGVGKTFLAKYISFKTGLPLITLDLASTISSYLGKTGKNIKGIIDYAQNQPSILLLDEFDALAKRRDESGDLGELKRIVNVLLKELENWPSNCIVIAATNHPELLDDAIWRRFSTKIQMDLPSKAERYSLWKYYLDETIVEIDDKFISVLSDILIDVTPADIEQISLGALRKQIISGGNIYTNIFLGIKDFKGESDKQINKVFAKKLHKEFGNTLTQREIADILGIGSSTVNRYLK